MQDSEVIPSNGLFIARVKNYWL